MERIRRVMEDPVFQQELAGIMELERERSFCGHGLEHLLDVARLSYIFNLEEQAGLDQECIYAAALLHDIGRGREYREGTPHHLAGVQLAGEILKKYGFEEEKQWEILTAIEEHRNSNPGSHEDCGTQTRSSSRLAEFLRRADRLSRNCFCCKAAVECNWPQEKKNRVIRY